MKYLEVVYNILTGEINTAKIHGRMDTVVMPGYKMKTIPYESGMAKDIGKKLFDGNKFVDNPNYVVPLTIEQQIDNCTTISDIKIFLKSVFVQPAI